MKTTNKVELSGYIGVEPEVKTLSNGSKMLRFSLATSEDYKSKTGEWVKNTTWHNIVMWNKTAEIGSTMAKSAPTHKPSFLREVSQFAVFNFQFAVFSPS